MLKRLLKSDSEAAIIDPEVLYELSEPCGTSRA